MNCSKAINHFDYRLEFQRNLNLKIVAYFFIWVYARVDMILSFLFKYNLGLYCCHRQSYIIAVIQRPRPKNQR